MKPSAGPCRRLFCFIFVKKANVMNKLFRSYHSGIKLVSLICLVLFPFIEMLATGTFPGLSFLLTCEVGGVSILLRHPQPDEEARPAFFSSVLFFVVFLLLCISGAGTGATVLAVLILNALHMAVLFKLRYSKVRSLFRHRLVWYALEGQSHLVWALALCVLATVALVFPECLWVQLSDAVLLAALYVLLFVTSRTGRIILLDKDKEMAVRQIVSCGLNDAQAKSRHDEGASMRELFEKVVSIMESSHPFLDESYSLQNLSAEVYTNKTYLSRTINIMSGKNFRQFINAYRVMYSVEMLKKNPRLRVDELASMSGFHSTVTYTMAFKANMNETPGEYSQRLRSNLV